VVKIQFKLKKLESLSWWLETRVEKSGLQQNLKLEKSDFVNTRSNGTVGAGTVLMKKTQARALLINDRCVHAEAEPEV
jgi:hypothetical protein